MPAASEPSRVQGTAALAAGLGVLVVGVGAMLGAGKLGEADSAADGCPVAQPVMANNAMSTAAANLRFIWGPLSRMEEGKVSVGSGPTRLGAQPTSLAVCSDTDLAREGHVGPPQEG